VTTDAWQNRSVFQVVEIADTVIQRLFKCRDQGAYLLHEFVLMPNRLHLLLTPDRGATLEKAMQLIKGGSSHEIHARRGHRMLVWQPGFHDCTIRDATDFQARREYIRTNPVEAGLVERAEDWPYGSASGKFRLDPMPERLGFRG
jgi:putative transposase